MANILGFEVNMPSIGITGLLSQSWIYILIIVLLTIIVGTALLLVLFFMTYNYKIELYENIGGGKQMVRTLKTRARRVKVGSGGEELFRLLRPRVYRTAYGKRIAPKTYAFATASDGYWYNITLGDLDTQLGILDVEPVERDMRMMSVAVEKIIQENYNPNKNQQVVMGIFLFIMVIVMLVGLYIIVGKIGGISTAFETSATKFQEIASTQAKTTQMILGGGTTVSGLIPGT